MTARCAYPVAIRVDGREWLTGCGKCLACRISRRSMWTMRMMHETEVNPECAFITLTYDNENLPSTPNKPYGILNPTDLQGFWKRLRKNLKLQERDTKIKYYACGEYGEPPTDTSKGYRPHYHAIVWGIHPAKDEGLVFRSWGLGRTQADLVEPESIQYVAGYVSKKLGFNNSENRQGYPRPFQTSSGGLGLDWLHENWTQVLYEAALTFRGRKIPIPRYYREKLDKYYNNVYLGMEERLCQEKIISDCDLLLSVVPQFGGRSWAQLSALERVVAHNALQRNGRLYNENLAKRQEIKLAGLAAKAAFIGKRRQKL